MSSAGQPRWSWKVYALLGAFLAVLLTMIAFSHRGWRAPRIYATITKYIPEDPELLSGELENKCRLRLQSRGVIRATHLCRELDPIITALDRARYRVDRPWYGYVEETFRVSLVMKSTVSTTAVYGFTAPYVQNLEATLSGTDFTIEPSGPQSKIATANHIVEWNWSVRPQRAGDKEVRIEVAANIVAESAKLTVRFTFDDEAIPIHIRAALP